MRYLGRPQTVAQIHKGKTIHEVGSADELLEGARNINLRRESLRFTGPIISERHYRAGDQQPYNFFPKHSLPLMLQGYDSKQARNEDAQPFYRQRREAFEELHRDRAKNESVHGFIERYGIGWRANEHDDKRLRVIPLVAALEGLEILVHSADSSAVDKVRIEHEYEASPLFPQGGHVWFSVRSVSGNGWHTKGENVLHSVPSVSEDTMYSIMAGIYSDHMCGFKANLGTRSRRASRESRRIEYFCQHDVAAILQFMSEQQQKVSTGGVDALYDPHEKVKASVPMVLNPIPLAGPDELQVYRALAYNTTIIPPKRNNQKGGFLFVGGERQLASERRLWEVEIEAAFITYVSRLGRDAMFIRQRVVDLEKFF